MQYGFVYVLTNEYMPGICKIGCTARSPTMRARELSGSTGVPGDFTLCYYAEVCNFEKVERAIHSALSGLRVNCRREFFSIEPLVFYRWLQSCDIVETDWIDPSLQFELNLDCTDHLKIGSEEQVAKCRA